VEFRKATLGNGLQVVAECNDRAYSMALAFFVKTGARDEADEIAGVSHFLEHMAFKGTPTRSAEDVNRELDEIGSHANAYTSEEQTVYFASVLPEYQTRATEILADMMRPTLRDDDFNVEKKVIIEEIRKYDDQPPYGAHEKCMAAHFGSHPLSHSVLGTEQTVGDMTPHAMRAYFEQRYCPGNMTLVAAGNVDFEQLVEDAEKHCGSWQRFEAARETPTAPPHTGFSVLVKPAAMQEYAVQIANGPSSEDEDRFAGRLAATIFGDDSGSRLYWELIDTGLAEYAAVGCHEYQGTGVVMTYLSCQPEEVADDLKRIRDLQLNLEQEGVTTEELERAQRKVVSHIVLQAERPINRLFSVGSGWVQRQQYLPLRDVLERYQSVTVDGISKLLARFPLSQNTTMVVGPADDVPPPDAP